MTLAEKRDYIRKFCNGKNCDECPLENLTKNHVIRCENLSDEMILMLYQELTTFGPAPVNTCVSCGAEIPEGRMVCPTCESEENKYESCDNCAFSHKEPEDEPCRKCKNNMLLIDPQYPSAPFNWKPVGYSEPDPIKPEYYNDTKITPFDVIDDWGLNFYLGNAVKYIKRAGKKAGNSRLQDLKKIREYIDHEIRAEED